VSAVTDTRIGTELAGYRIEALLGRGGMSVVYRADHARLKRKVALKLLAPELAEDERFRERFLRESQLAASLDHPNVVPIYDAGEVEGLLYIAMRYVPGTDLKALLRNEGALEPERALALVAQVGSALDAAHERGLVHRDVKPSNVLLAGREGREHCYLADFGLSTSASDRSAATDPQQIVGTIDYVAPEQIRGAEVDGRADVYSLACLLYESLTGDVPFRHVSDVAVIYAHLEEPPPKASGRGAALGPELDAVLARGMAKAPEERWETCAALVQAVRSTVGGEAMPGRMRGTRRSAVAALAVAAAGAATAAALLAGGGAPAIASADTLVRIDTRANRASGAVALGAQPTAVTVCGGSVWVTRAGGTVSQIDPKTLAVHTVQVQGRPTDVANVGDLAAVVSGPPERVTMVDAGFGQISDSFGIPTARASATAVAFGRDVWIANPTARTLDRVGPPYTSVAQTVRLSGVPRLVAAGQGAVWVVGGRTLWKVDAGAQRVLVRIRLAFSPSGVDAGNGGVWLVDRGGGAVVRVDPAAGSVVKRIPVGHAPTAVAVGRGAVWVSNGADGTVSEIDASRDAVVKTIRAGSEPVDLVAGLGAVWVVRRSH
jgi:DNA-binding beta-propeller fold protein YncE/tRNA A-37 threonylcarbamoyl transferase component Bud32